MTAGVILESEELHRLAYNAAFKHFDIRCNGVGEIDQWSVDFYDMLQVRNLTSRPAVCAHDYSSGHAMQRDLCTRIVQRGLEALVTFIPRCM